MILVGVVGSDGPDEARIFSHQRMNINGIKSMAASGWVRRTDFLVSANAISAVKLVVIGQRRDPYLSGSRLWMTLTGLIETIATADWSGSGFLNAWTSRFSNIAGTN